MRQISDRIRRTWVTTVVRLANDRGEGMISNTLFMVGAAVLTIGVLAAAGIWLGAQLDLWPAPSVPALP